MVEPPLWKILVNWDDYSQYMEKWKMFQTTNQLMFPLFWLPWNPVWHGHGRQLKSLPANMIRWGTTKQIMAWALSTRIWVTHASPFGHLKILFCLWCLSTLHHPCLNTLRCSACHSITALVWLGSTTYNPWAWSRGSCYCALYYYFFFVSVCVCVCVS